MSRFISTNLIDIATGAPLPMSRDGMHVTSSVGLEYRVEALVHITDPSRVGCKIDNVDVGYEFPILTAGKHACVFDGRLASHDGRERLRFKFQAPTAKKKKKSKKDKGVGRISLNITGIQASSKSPGVPIPSVPVVCDITKLHTGVGSMIMSAPFAAFQTYEPIGPVVKQRIRYSLALPASSHALKKRRRSPRF